jgi:hypothetical protein
MTSAATSCYPYNPASAIERRSWIYLTAIAHPCEEHSIIKLIAAARLLIITLLAAIVSFHPRRVVSLH